MPFEEFEVVFSPESHTYVYITSATNEGKIRARKTFGNGGTKN